MSIAKQLDEMKSIQEDFLEFLEDEESIDKKFENLKIKFEFKKQIESDKNVTLIEYATFFGSIQIFNFLKNEKAKLTPSLWLYAIHSKNATLIHLLEDLDDPINKEKKEKLYKELFNESIKCHYNNIANYFLNNYFANENENSNDIFIQSLKYYNFSFLQNECICKSSFCHLCHYDYYSLVYALLTSRNIDVNSILICNYIFYEIQIHIFK